MISSFIELVGRFGYAVREQMFGDEPEAVATIALIGFLAFCIWAGLEAEARLAPRLGYDSIAVRMAQTHRGRVALYTLLYVPVGIGAATYFY